MGSMPRTVTQPGESRCRARGMVPASASAGSPIHTQIRESCSTIGYDATRAVRGTRFCPGTYTQVPLVSYVNPWYPHTSRSPSSRLGFSCSGYRRCTHRSASATGVPSSSVR